MFLTSTLGIWVLEDSYDEDNVMSDVAQMSLLAQFAGTLVGVASFADDWASFGCESPWSVKISQLTTWETHIRRLIDCENVFPFVPAEISGAFVSFGPHAHATINNSIKTAADAMLSFFSSVVAKVEASCDSHFLQSLHEEVTTERITKLRARVLFKACIEDKTAAYITASRSATKFNDVIQQLCVEHLTHFLEENAEPAQRLRDITMSLSQQSKTMYTLTAMIELWRSPNKAAGETRPSMCSRALTSIPPDTCPQELLQLLKQAAEGRPPFHGDSA